MIQYKNQFMVKTLDFDLTAKLYNIYIQVYAMFDTFCNLLTVNRVILKFIENNNYFLFSINIGNVLIECN